MYVGSKRFVYKLLVCFVFQCFLLFLSIWNVIFFSINVFFWNTFWERSRNTATLHSSSYLFYVNGSYDYSKFALIYSCFLVLPSVNKAKCYVFLSYCYLSFIFVPNYHWWFGWVNVIKFNEQLVAMKKNLENLHVCHLYIEIRKKLLSFHIL